MFSTFIRNFQQIEFFAAQKCAIRPTMTYRKAKINEKQILRRNKNNVKLVEPEI